LEAIQDTDLFITEVKVKKGNVIYVFLDGDHGVSVDACSKVSRYVENKLDRTKDDFELNVSSFGLGRPLLMFRQYRNAEGKMLAVKMKDQSKIKGVLLKAEEDNIQIETIGTKKNPSIIHRISMDEIEEAKIEVVF
jgi:ribosome maturation factor RimP